MNKLVVYFPAPEAFIDRLSSVSANFELIVCKNRDELEPRLAQTEILITLFAWPDDMAEIFKHGDYIINLLPDSPKTLGLVDQSFFSLMKKSACFINLGRGSTVNQNDLIEALQNKTIRALVSDVYETEPLPQDHPLWQMDNVILTPHIAGVSPKYLQRALEIIEHNLKVYVSRTGEMRNVVDFAKGY
jgi:phosphoglycerate dehydrogenase-like enzyme